MKVDPEELFCESRKSKRCYTSNEIDLFYSDDDHLSKYGSKLLVSDLFSKNQLTLRRKE